MKIGKVWTITILAAFMLAVLGLNCAHALDGADWENQWFKAKLSGNGYCNFIGSMEKDRLNTRIYIYIDDAVSLDTMESYVVFFSSDDSKWVDIPMTLKLIMGDYDKGVLNTHLVVEGDTADSDVYLGLLLSGKANKRTGGLKKASLKTIGGVELGGECTMSMKFNAKLIKESKVPQEVIDAIN